MITGKHSMLSAIQRAISQRLNTFEGAVHTEEQAPTDTGAVVVIVEIENGERLLITIEELGDGQPPSLPEGLGGERRCP